MTLLDIEKYIYDLIEEEKEQKKNMGFSNLYC